MLVPGYALAAAVLPTDEISDLAERLALGFGLSLGIVAILAQVLDRTAGGLSADAIRVAVTATSLGLLLVAALRRRRAGPAAAAAAGARSIPGTSRAVRFTRVIAVASVLVAGFAYVVAITNQPPRPTAFFVLGPEGKLADYAREVAVGETVRLRIGVDQGDDGAGSYEASLVRNGRVVATAGGIQVRNGQRWEGELTFVADQAGPDQELLIQLGSPAATQPLRTLRLWIDVRERAAG